MSALAGKVTIVTGASSGIGRATARLFADQGARVVVAARRQDELDALVSEITRSVLYVASDASSFVTGEAHRVDGGVSISHT